MKKKILASMLCVLIAVAIVGCSSSTGNYKVSKKVNEVDGIEFMIPDNWSTNNENSEIENLKNKYDSLRDVVEISGVSISDNKNRAEANVASLNLLDKYAVQEKDKLLKILSQSALSGLTGGSETGNNQKTEQITVAGQPAEKTSLNITKDGQETYVEMFTFSHGSRIYVFIFMVYKQNQEALSKITKNIFESVSFTESEPEKSTTKETLLSDTKAEGEEFFGITGLEITIPDNWKENTDSHFVEDIKNEAEAKGEYLFFEGAEFFRGNSEKMRITGEMISGMDTSEQRKNKVKTTSDDSVGAMIAAADSVIEKNEKEITVGGEKAIRSTFILSIKGNNIYFEHITFAYDNYIYTVMFSSQPENKEKINNEIGSILNTIKFY